ncbi:MAG: low temperature requirement protein A [Actinomycetota bacterium]|nr:low temperature requirement protein A [Actinomycetota bacterium]
MVSVPRPQISATMRETENVTPLELFFDLVFVLALTQCTALMADEPTWEGLAKGILVLSLLWWAWVGYAWLTSVVDPEEGAVRIAMFAAMAAFLIVSLCIPQAFSGLALEFAIAYGFVRAGQIGLFVIASREERELRSSVRGLAISTAIGVGLILGSSFLDAGAQGAVFVVAILLDVGGPYFFGADGWKLVPEHFAERHGLIIIIALGESIVAIGAGADAALTFGIAAAAVFGITLAAAQWWAYFDVVALVAARRLAKAAPGREQNEMARDSYSYLHLPMVAGIVLVALGLKKTLGDVGEPLKLVPAFALVGGLSLYLLAHVLFRLRNIRTLNTRRLLVAVIYLALLPVAVELPALATVAIVTAIFVALIAYETIAFADARDRIRHQLTSELGSPATSNPTPSPARSRA